MDSKITILEKFGEEFVVYIRDSTVKYCRRLFEATLPQKSTQGKAVQELMIPFNNVDREILNEQLVPLIVDIAFSNFYWFLQQKHEKMPVILGSMSLVVRDQEGVQYSIEKISDGLAGDYDWWVEQFNQEGVFTLPSK